MDRSNLISKLPEVNHLQKRILYTLLFLAIYRIGVHVPIPGVNTEALADFFRDQGENFFGMFNMYTGGALEKFSVVALGVLPYISASIIAQLLTVVVPHLEQLSKEGESGRNKITKYTRYGTVALALIQGFMISNQLVSSDFQGRSLVYGGAGLSWKLMATLSLTAGTAFVMWLGERITDKGVGNGISLIIFCGIVAGLPRVIVNTYEKYNSSQIGLLPILVICAICIFICGCVVFVEQAARLVPIQYAKRQVGRRQYGGQESSLPLRVNSAGVIPPIFAGALLQFPITVAHFRPNSAFSNIVGSIFLGNTWMYNTVYVVLIMFFAFFYTGIVFKPDDVAENLKKYGGFIPGIRPGARTSEYLGKVVMRLTLTGSIYLAAVCVVPTILSSNFNVNFYFGGTSLLIVVGVALETFRQIEAHRQSLRYDAFLKNTAIRPRGGR